MALTNSSGHDAPSSQQEQRQRDANESDLDPQAFLQSVRELSEKREREDAERYRKLEEEVVKGREERAARRAERARSISPEKASISTPSNRTTLTTLSRTTTNASLASPPPAMTPPSSAGSRETAAHSDSLHRLTGSSQTSMDPVKQSPKVEDVPDFQGFGAIKRSSTPSGRSTTTTAAASPAQRSSVPNPTPAPSATNLARSGTLSWQQRRPTSRVGGSSSRPLSVVATHNSAAHSRTASIDEPGPSRDQIAASLGARDPSWFKQTAERGVGSAAFRKSKDETAMEDSISPGRRELPGLSRERSIDSDRHTSPPISESINSQSVSRNSQRESVYSAGSRFSATSSTSSTKPDLKSLIAADEGQRRVSPTFVSEQGSTGSGETAGFARTLTMSSSQARIANGTDRPVSPTKGMGGFVQSAMMKRSDSQNKRWSAQPSTIVSRHNSMASTRSGYSGLQNSHSLPKLDTADPSGGSTEERPSRPTSSSNREAGSTAQDSEVLVKPTTPRHSRSKSVASNYSTNDDLLNSPGSPSKRFSPNKSSWIESSLTKPESPKPAPSKNSAPSWMADLASRKAQRASADSTPPGATSPHVERDGLRPISRPGSPLKHSPFGPGMLKRPESREFTPSSATPTNKFKTAHPADKHNASPIIRSPSPAKQTVASPVLPTLHNPSDPGTVKDDSHSMTATSDVEPVVLDHRPQTPEKKAEPALSQPPPAVERPSTPENKTVRPRAKSLRSPPPPAKSQPTSEATTPKMPNDFRSQLKSRPPPEMKTAGQPEFLSKFGNLRKTQAEKFVAPDVLKDNILRGKSGLVVSSGPMKTERKDELKESLVAKKDDIQKAKDEGRNLPGQKHERKTSLAPQEPPAKPEALSRRELLGRSDSARNGQPTEKTREATPEALARHKSLKQKSMTMPPPEKVSPSEPNMDVLSKQVSAPSSTGLKQSEQSSKLAARFNPGLAGLLARGPPSATPPRTGSPADLDRSESASIAASETHAQAVPLQDMRKGRAKGPRRKGAKASSSKADAISTPVAATQPDKLIEAQPLLQSPKPISAPKPTIAAANASLTKSPPLPGSPNFSRPKPSATFSNKPNVTMGSDSTSTTPRLDGPPDSPISVARAKPQALPGSAASVLAASLKKTSVEEHSASPVMESKKPVAPAKSPSLSSKPSISLERAPAEAIAVPEFKGFGSMKKQRSPQPADDDKENTDSSIAPVKATTSFWGRRTAPQRDAPPSPIQLPTQKDEEAAMRSAGLLASKSGLGISGHKTGDQSATPPSSAGLPPKPAKSSRIVSGQLAEATPNKGSTSSSPIEKPVTEAGRLLSSVFGSVPKSRGPLTIAASAVISSCDQASDTEDIKYSRKTVCVVYPDGSFKTLPPQEEYTLFDESVFVFTNVFVNPKGVKASQVFMWIGDSAFGATADAALVHAKRLARENGSTIAVCTVRQGRESASFLQAFGGILITRRQSRETATKQYMLCGRKHLGHIVFDEVDFGVDSLRAGYVYLVSFPITLQETKLYLWKGPGCSVEELSAARLAAMDLSETGEIIEVDGGAEFSSFLKIFGPSTTKSDVPMPSELWKQKQKAPDKFKVRLFKIQQPETKTNLITSLWLRRPSWNSLSPSRAPAVPLEDIKVEVKHLSPFTQTQMEAEGIYLLDAHSQLYIIIGSLFPSQSENVRNTLLAQALLFASDYATLSASMEDRIAIPKCSVLFSGVPDDVKVLFRHWDDSRGLWGTAGLMAGSTVSQGRELKLMPLEEVLTEVCRD